MDAASAIAPPLFLGALAASWAITALVLRMLRRRRVLDHPNERSSHATATPRGGGLGVVAVVLTAWPITAIFAGAPAPGDVGWLLLGGAGLALVSWIDDLRALPPLPRLAVQMLAVGLGLLALARHGTVFQGLLPAPLDLAVAAALWLWFINLFNFMDGIDGIAGVEAGAIGLGLFAATLAAGRGMADAGLPALAIAGATLGFLWWNWQPARIFLGDVGSVPLGYLLGWLLLAAAAEGLWQVALILPLYYLADASITLARRAARGAALWQAHREHFYQRAVVRGLSHAHVAAAVLAGNVLLVALALAAAAGPRAGGGALWPLGAAALVVAALLAYLALARRVAPGA